MLLVQRAREGETYEIALDLPVSVASAENREWAISIVVGDVGVTGVGTRSDRFDRLEKPRHRVIGTPNETITRGYWKLELTKPLSYNRGGTNEQEQWEQHLRRMPNPKRGL